MKEEKVILLCNYHGTGGAQLNAHLLKSGFLARGTSSKLVFLFNRDDDFLKEDSDKIVIATAGGGALCGLISIVKQIATIVRLKPSAIIGFQPASNVIAAVSAKISRNCTVVATQRNPASEQSWLWGKLDNIMGTIGAYDHNICVSESVKDSFRLYNNNYKSKLKVIYNGTPPLPNVEGAPDNSNVAKRRNTIGVVGRLHAQKNPLFALEVARELTDYEFVFIGDGPERIEVEKKIREYEIEDRVKLLGTLNQLELSKAYNEMDALIFCSAYEGFGRVLVEAMSKGIPVISNDIPVAREVGGGAPIFKELKVELWRDAILEVMNDDSKYKEMQQKGLVRAASFSAASMIDGYHRLVVRK